MAETIDLASRRPQKLREFNSFSELVDTLKQITLDDVLTEQAQELTVIDENKLPLYDINSPIGELSPLDKGTLNYMAKLDSQLIEVIEAIMNSIEPFKLAAIEGVLLQINRKQYKTAYEGLSYTGFMVKDEVNELLHKARKLIMQLRFTELYLHSNIGERCGFTKYAIYEGTVVPAFRSYSLLSTDSY